jgi:hypothetical protein
MKRLIKIVFFLVLIFPLPANAMGIRYKGQYIPIDSLSSKDNLRFVNLDLKTRRIDLFVNNQLRSFIQTYDLDTTQVFNTQYLIEDVETEKVYLQIRELLAIDNDSIYFSASYQKFDKKGNTSKIIKIDKLSIKKMKLLGVVVSPSTKEIKKKERTYGWFVGTLAVVIITLGILSGN